MLKKHFGYAVSGLRATLMKHNIVANSILGGIDISDVKIGQSSEKFAIFGQFLGLLVANSAILPSFPLCSKYLLHYFEHFQHVMELELEQKI